MRETGLTYTLTSGGGSLTINPAGFSSAGYYCKAIEVQSELRAAIVARPQQHGSYVDPGYEGGLGLRLECYMLHAGASSRQSLSDTAVTVLRSMVSGGGSLTWTPQDGSASRTLSGLSLAAPLQIASEAGTVKSWSALFKAAKPYSESASATTVDSSSLTSTGAGLGIPLTIPFTLTTSGGGTLTYTNSGSVPVRPKLQIYGPATAPKVTNVTSQQSLLFSGSIASGEYWEIDLFERTVTLNGGSSTAPLRTIVPASSTWFECAVGDSTLQLTCSGSDSTNTKLRALQVSAWA